MLKIILDYYFFFLCDFLLFGVGIVIDYISRLDKTRWKVAKKLYTYNCTN